MLLLLLLLLHVSNKRPLHARDHLRSFTIPLHGSRLARDVTVFSDLLEDLSQLSVN